jgi:hypothetical protein
MEPWTTLSKRDLAAVTAARQKAVGGQKPTAAEQRAVERFREVESQKGFCGLVKAVPQAVLRELLGGLSAGEVRTIGKRLGVSLGGKLVDLEAALPKLAALALEVVDAGDVAKTYGELATKLGLGCADPERTLKAYHARGMPGTPGRPGKANGSFPVEACRLWIEVHTRSNALPGGSDELHQIRERITRLDLEIREREQLEQIERLADVGEIIAFCQSVVFNAKAMLEALPDEVLAVLPEEVDQEGRRSIHGIVTQMVDTTFDELARLSLGDDDPTDDDSSEEDSTTSGDEPTEGGGTSGVVAEAARSPERMDFAAGATVRSGGRKRSV